MRASSLRPVPAILTGLSAAALGCVGVFAPACVDYTFEQKVAVRVKEATVVVPAAVPVPADILFVVDNSGSMADEQNNVARNFDKFINEIVGAGNYRIAIVTTDVNIEPGDPGEIVGLSSFGFSAVDPMVLNDFNRDACAAVSPRLEHGCFRGPPETRVITSSMSRTAQIDGFITNVKVGSCGSGNEQGLNAMILALENTAQGKCNEGFLRPDANLVVVFVTDENDCDVQNGQCSANPPNVQNYVERLKALKPNGISQIRVAVIAGAVEKATGWEASNCRTGGAMGGAECGGTCRNRPPEGSHATGCAARPNTCGPTEFCDNDRCENRDLQYWDYCYWCSYYKTADCCSAVPGQRYVEFAKRFETAISAATTDIKATGCRTSTTARIGCLIDSICQEEFDKTLRKIASDLVLSSKYTLNPRAVYPEGVVVKVNGVTLKYGVDFDITNGGTVLTIKGPHTPKAGENVEIYFVIDS